MPFEQDLRTRYYRRHRSDVLALEIDRLAGARKRSAFAIDVLWREVRRNRQRETLRATAGNWKAENHPELARCGAAHVEEIRSEVIVDSKKTKEFLHSLEFYAVAQEIATHAGLLRRDWRLKGQTLSYTDVTIAAVASSNGLRLLTDNRKHFPMPELNLLPLSAAPQ